MSPASSRHSTAHLVTPKDGTREPELIGVGSNPPAGEWLVSIAADQKAHHPAIRSDSRIEVRNKPGAATFYETDIRGVFSRDLLPPRTAPQEQNARKAPLSKENLRALDIGNAIYKTKSGQPIQPSSIPRLPTTAANVKAFGGANSRPSPTRKKSSTQEQTSAPETLPTKSYPPYTNETTQDSGRMKYVNPEEPPASDSTSRDQRQIAHEDSLDSASSSAPTSAMPEATRAKSFRILSLYGQFNRVRNLLRYYCRQGKASAVKFLFSYKRAAIPERRSTQGVVHHFSQRFRGQATDITNAYVNLSKTLSA